MALKPEIQYWSVVKPLKPIQQKQLVELFTIKENEYETCEKKVVSILKGSNSNNWESDQ